MKFSAVKLPTRICGIGVKPTDEKQWCKKCKAEVQVMKSNPVRLMSKEWINLFCAHCGRHLGCYKLKKEDKK